MTDNMPFRGQLMHLPTLGCFTAEFRLWLIATGAMMAILARRDGALGNGASDRGDPRRAAKDSCALNGRLGRQAGGQQNLE
ncbi:MULTISPECIES: hypothetical protein [Mesorhizobium]|uniref:hypothetical protein n=1 Tax=Mesorhizobium TaxID=68287 RepID=UPI001402CC7E|nr:MULTISPECIES: hypothetical protein [Mesorhizobium]